ncbi:SMI1/KNR4 family protein [Paenibacillus contaminans]|uniref:SMI1/KNR4 family protein n=1 Tax=Paenibacillus contaminans TaxID=450362 RepID=A0A329MTQ3_9BACL|nr:SMI1/KNR4 family protein [Paenibacillus contaminans]RAV23345.1 SMI1/KNR4 family protein [Paenibacillus contaminans]
MMFWKKESQLDRINNKLEKAMRKDSAFLVFGSSSHKYTVYDKLTTKELADWQVKYQVTLPEPYAQFLTKVGNGGAGPFYGIYPLEKAASYTGTNALATKCVLYPGMSKEEWNPLIEPLISDEDISDLEYDATREKVLGGMLCIGTQGCEYDMYLVLEGDFKGKIVYTSDFYQDHPFFFVYEDNFLDWYERWLDEIILDYDIAWFGSRMPGDENALIQVYQDASNEKIKSDGLAGMFKFKKITQPAIDFLKSVADQRQSDRTTAIQLICKTSFDAGRDYLMELLLSNRNEDFLQALMILNWYGKSYDLTEFIKAILQSLDKVRDPETLRHVGYVLESSDAITVQNFEPFLCHTDSSMQAAAIYAARNCNDKSESWEIIERMLLGGDEIVMKNTILYWGLIPHEKLLPYYKAAWPDYKNNENFRDKFIGCLKELHLPEDYFDKE